MSDTERLKARLRAIPEGPPPPPWRSVKAAKVGGLTDVGYAGDSDLLLVVSMDGRGVFDCLTGERVARLQESLGPESHWHDTVHLVAAGIGPLEGQQVRLAGLWGGGLPLQTRDGWRLRIETLVWGTDSVFLIPPDGELYREEKASGCTKLLDWDPVRAAGFSHTGRSFVIAQAHSLYIFARDEAPGGN